MINTIIVDDEPHARADLQQKISTDERFVVTAQCANAFDAVREIHTRQPDVVFLDINMPKLSGIELLSMLEREKMPRIVFVTAHGEYAIEAFKENAIDFLLKPVSPQRLAITLQRLVENHQPQAAVQQTFSSPLTLIPCYRANHDYLINIDQVVHLFSTPTTGVQLATVDDPLCFYTSLSLKVFEENSSLIRCHRQHMVNPKYIKMIEKLDNGLGQIHLGDERTIPISRNAMGHFPVIG